MSNPSKQRGTRYETEVVTYLREHGFPAAERRALQGAQDKGDITNVPRWTLELKAEKAISLASYVDEARVEAANAGTDWFAAIVKRRGQSVAASYVVMPLDVWAELADWCQRSYRMGR